MLYIHIVKLCHNWANGFWAKSAWSKCIHFGVVFGSCVLVHAETCILVCYCCDLIYTWFSQLTQNFMHEAATKQLLMQKLLIDEFQYSTCCNKFRTFIIKVTSICNIYFTEIKKIYSLRHITMMLYLLKMMKIPGTHAFTNLNAAIQMLAKNITWVCGTMCNHAVFHIASPDQEIKGMNRLVYFYTELLKAWIKAFVLIFIQST